MNDPAPAACTEGVRIRGDGYTAEAGWFGPEDRPRFGWLYTPDTPAKNCVGIVIVPPFGVEAICAHRTLRHLAEDTAKAGFTVVRFDLDGTGDSAGDDHDPDRVEAWITSIADACDCVRTAGTSRVVLVGARLGAALTVLAAMRRQDVAGLVAINGVVRGRDFLREMRALQATMGLRPPPSPPPDDGSQEVNGFIIASEARERIGAIDLLSLSPAPMARVLLIERGDMPVRTPWPEHLRAQGVDIEVRQLPDLIRMFDIPHLAQVPDTLSGTCIDWLKSISSHDLATTAPHAHVLPRSQTRITVGGEVLTEQACLVDGTLFGILTTSRQDACKQGVALFNTGANTHIGANRLYVNWARKLAGEGICVLRADLSGLGDSPARHGSPEHLVYGPHGIRDAITLTDWLIRRGIPRVTVAGICSGGYHALRAAIAGARIDSALMINPGALRDVGVIPNESTEQTHHSYYNNQLKDGRIWRKLAKASPRKLLRVARWYLSTYGGTLMRDLARGLRVPMHGDLGSELRDTSKRGARLRFVFSADDPSRAKLATFAGSVARKLGRSGQLTTTLIDGPDHTFTQCWSHPLLLRAVLDHLRESPSPPP